jgi:hypothetical protein
VVSEEGVVVELVLGFKGDGNRVEAAFWTAAALNFVLLVVASLCCMFDLSLVSRNWY